MVSYRFRRRSFLAGIGGAFGLRLMLDNLEASAQGVVSPPRLLTMYWPSGTVRYHFVSAQEGRTYTTSRILQPFETAGLREDMIVLYGFSQVGIQNLGSGEEGGTVIAVTGASTPGTRVNGGETDDPIAGGPSFDQIFLKHVPELQRPAGPGHAHGIGDARVDSHETSTRCLSYAYETRDVEVARPSPMTMPEHVPQMPELSPAALYAKLFSGFMPGGGTPENVEAAKRALRLKKSVLDSALSELGKVRTLAPSSEWPKVDAHADAIRRLELQIQAELEMEPSPSCAVPAAPDSALVAKTGEVLSADYANPKAAEEDASHVERVVKAHAAVLRAAFQCDLIRVATLNWCPGTNHVAFGGMYPDDPEGAYIHHAMTHRVGSSAFYTGSPPSADAGIYEFATNVHTWFNQKTADILVDFKNATDVFGNALLDHTIVPFVTDVAEPADTSTSKPALILGGRALGLQGGTYVNMGRLTERSHNSLWMTIAQALMKTNDPLALLADEVFIKTSVAPIPELWLAPA